MAKIEDNPPRDLWKALRDPTLREKVRRELSEQTGFQQGLAVDAITRSFFMHTTQDIGCPNIITLIAKDEQHVEKFCRSLQKVIELHLEESSVFIDASKQHHQDCIPANGFAFVLIRKTREFLNEGLFEFNKWKGGDRSEQAYEKAERHLNTLGRGYLKTAEGKVNYENVTFIFHEDSEKFRHSTIDKFENVDELVNAKPRLYQALEEVNGRRRHYFSPWENIDKIILDYQSNGDIVLLNQPSFYELSCYLGDDSAPEELTVLHYADEEAKFITLLSCVSEPGLTFQNLRSKQEDLTYEITHQLELSGSGGLSPNDAILSVKSGAGEGSAKQFVRELRDDVNIRVAIFGKSPSLELEKILTQKGLNIRVEHFSDVSRSYAFHPDIAIICNSLDNEKSVADTMRLLQDIYSGLPLFLVRSDDRGQEDDLCRHQKRFAQLIGEITIADLPIKFAQFFRGIQLTKALWLQDIQQNTYLFPSYNVSESREQKTYSLDLSRPFRRSTEKRGYYTVERGISERLDDICGLEELQKILIENFEQVKSGVSRALLLCGPPGCGKTFSVRALAGSVKKYTLLSTTAAKLLGVSGDESSKSAYLERLFELARRMSPAIIFIDEIHNILTSKESPVSQSLLSCLDGFQKDGRGILVIGATSHENIHLDPDVDRGHVRSLRFEKVDITLPDYNTRESYFLKWIPELVKDEYKGALRMVTDRTSGRSIADLKLITENVLHKNARSSSLNLEKLLNSQSMKLKFGITGDEYLVNPPSEREVWHESGHALVQVKLFEKQRIDCVTVCSRAGRGGFLAIVKSNNDTCFTKEDCIKEIAVCLAGRVAEALKYGCPSSGAAEDILKANKIARNAIFKLGLVEEYGPFVRSFGDDQSTQLREFEEMYVRNLLDAGESLAKQKLEEDEALLEKIFDGLKNNGTLHHEQLRAINHQLSGADRL